jgi:hypothetical protein
MDKQFIGRCKAGKYENQIEIGFTIDDLRKLKESLNDKGWVNIRVNKGKESGKVYAEIVKFDSFDVKNNQPKQTSYQAGRVDNTVTYKQPEIVSTTNDDLPF